MSRRGNPPWRRAPQPDQREQRRLLRKPRAAREARERKAELPWERARALIRESALPGGCTRVIDAIAERNHELGKGCADRPVYQAFGNKGDPRREQAARQLPENPLPALAEATGMSRRWVIACILSLVAAGILRKVPGGKFPDGDPRNVKPDVRHRNWRTGQECVRSQSVGGAGWANGYLVEGIPDPEPPPPEPEPAPPPEPEPAPRPEAWRAIKERMDHEHLERQRTRSRGP